VCCEDANARGCLAHGAGKRLSCGRHGWGRRRTTRDVRDRCRRSASPPWVGPWQRGSVRDRTSNVQVSRSTIRARGSA
jgi:hypothetical protein